MKLNSRTITFRAIKPADQRFLRKLYASTRAEELDMVPWSDQEKENFIDLQFKAQHQFYQENFKSAKFDLILENKKRIGRFYIDRRASEIRIIDIALLPECRGQGIGNSLMQEALDEAKRKKINVTIHVEKNNPAMSLYYRLGFTLTEDQGVYNLMEWSCPQDE